MLQSTKLCVLVVFQQHAFHFIHSANYFLGHISVFCQRGGAIDGDANSCKFDDVKSAMWKDDYTILVFEKSVNKFRILEFQRKYIERINSCIMNYLTAYQ